jgi:hypothetical protein
MSPRARYGVMAARLLPVRRATALAVATASLLAVAVATTAPAMAASPTPVAGGSGHAERAAVHGTPTAVIDAKTDPDAAGAALSSGCQDLKNCSWQTTNIGSDYGPRTVIGDEVYNCSTDDGDNAEAGVEVSDELSETTSLSEEVSLKLQGGLIGLASASLEFKAFSKQAETFSTKVTTNNTVSIQPGEKGYNTTQILSANVTGDTYITAGINKLIEVKNIDLSFPGFQDSQDQGKNQVIFNGNTEAMTQDDIKSRCDAVNGSPGLGVVKGHGRRKVLTGSFKLTLCRTGAHCKARKVIGPPPPRISTAAARLTAAGRTYAAGTDSGGDIRLTVRRSVKPGTYTLELRRLVSQNGHRSVTYRTWRVPVTIR